MTSAGMLLLMLASTATANEPMSDADRDRLVRKLGQSSAALTASTAGLTPEQWSFKPAPDRWSVAECAEHIAVTEAFILDRMSEFMTELPESGSITNDMQKDDIVASVMIDRSKTFEAPDPLRPTNRFGSPEGSLAEFERVRATTIALVRETVDLRAYAGDHPIFGPMDALGWVLFISGHAERHTAQIEEVKAHPDFPR